ncbi:MAG: hypothetical protein ACR2LY_03625 [Thermoleophilaceae bacterium]
MSIEGSPYAWFRRSIEAGRGLDAWAAAHELESLSLADALALCLVLLDEDAARYDRAAVRWVGRLGSDARGLDLAGLSLVTDALVALPGPDPGPAIAALTLVLERRGERDTRELLEGWERRRR